MIKIEKKDGSRFWVLSVGGDELFGRVSGDSSYREHAMEAGGGRYVLLEDDRALFNRLLRSAVGGLWLELARMGKQTDRGVVFTDDAAEMRLEVSPNHDDNLTAALDGFVADHLSGAILCEWYLCCGQPGLAAQCEAAAGVALRRILSVVHYRKKAVRRPVNPIF